MTDKMKLLVISDDVRGNSGVAHQAHSLLSGLAKKYNYRIHVIGGGYSSKPPPNLMQPQKIAENYEVVTAVEGYGNEQTYRAYLDLVKPDVLLFITDPRFYYQLWDIENEIHNRNVGLAYWHVWDNDPAPYFNMPFYASTDVIGCCSRKTKEIVDETLNHYKMIDDIDKRIKYIPIIIDERKFYRMKIEEKNKAKENFFKMFGMDHKDKFVFFWNNRNCNRKRVADLIEIFSDVVKSNPKYKDNVFLMLHTGPLDNVGHNLYLLGDRFGITDNLLFSKDKVSVDRIRELYNIADCTLNIASYEGFGLSSLESLFCGTYIINNKTGGLIDQIDENDPQFAGEFIDNTRIMQGNMGGLVHYIYEDFPNKKTLFNKMIKVIEMNKEEKESKELYTTIKIKEKFNYDKMLSDWNELLLFCNQNKKAFYDRNKIRSYNFDW